MKLSLPLFVAASALLVMCSRHAWAVVRERGLLTVLALLTAVLCSCGAQVVTKNDGTRIANVTVLSKTSLDVNADGSVKMRADANVAAKEIGKGVDRAIGAGLVKTGISALQSVGNNAVDAIR